LARGNLEISKNEVRGDHEIGRAVKKGQTGKGEKKVSLNDTSSRQSGQVISSRQERKKVRKGGRPILLASPCSVHQETEMKEREKDQRG